jgi:uncharacterized membrane protein
MTKTFSFGVLHVTVAFTVAYLMTGSVMVGGAIAMVEPAINTVAYFFHEKVWERFRKRQVPTHREIGAVNPIFNP